MEGLDLNENPEMPDLSNVKNYFKKHQSIDASNFIGKITINCKNDFKQSDFDQMLRVALENIRRDTQI